MAFAGIAMIQTGDYYSEIKRGLRLFGDIYKNISEKYVDELSPHDVIRSGIDGLLSSLDPYTVYYEGDESSDIDVLMMGKYGGVGISIGIKDSYITVISTTDGSPGQRAGILPGDRIIAVDGLTSKTLKYSEMANYVKGEPGTKVKLTIMREGEKNPIEFELIREMIAVENIAYAGMVNDQIGYIKLTKFSKTADSDMLQALKELKRSGMKALVLDLRGNPGGLLDVAIVITNFFVSKGETITYTRGRTNEANRYYRANEDPLLPDLPLAVLVDGGSASASEIVIGALQDLDRAVIIGNTTFGKGLVQTVYPLQERNTMLKITTAKYFTPSGRCIQKQDYSNHKANGKIRQDDDLEVFGDHVDTVKSSNADSVRALVFKTRTGRPVFANGGIRPDVEVKALEYSAYYTEILKKGLIFDYSTHFVSEHKNIDSTFTIDRAILDNFKQYLVSKNFSYRPAVEKELNDLADLSRKNNYPKNFVDRIEELKLDARAAKVQDFENNLTLIRSGLENEIVSRYFGNKARVLSGFRSDEAYQEAIKTLKDREKYKLILAGR